MQHSMPPPALYPLSSSFSLCPTVGSLHREYYLHGPYPPLPLPSSCCIPFAPLAPSSSSSSSLLCLVATRNDLTSLLLLIIEINSRPVGNGIRSVFSNFQLVGLRSDRPRFWLLLTKYCPIEMVQFGEIMPSISGGGKKNPDDNDTHRARNREKNGEKDRYEMAIE